MNMIGNISKFSFGELMSNDNGKTSGSGTMGVLICTIGALSFFMGCLDKTFFTHSVDVISQSVIFTGIGVSLLGIRKMKSSDEKVAEINNTPPITPTDIPPAPLNS